MHKITQITLCDLWNSNARNPSLVCQASSLHRSEWMKEIATTLKVDSINLSLVLYVCNIHGI